MASLNTMHIGNCWIGLYTTYPSHSPWSHCAANPLAFIDPDGEGWTKITDNKGYTIDYDWVDDKDAYDKDHNLLPGMYEMAILFTAEGEEGKTFDSQNRFNIGTSIAKVYGKNGKEDITEFNAFTYPSDLEKYPTIPAGDYEAMRGRHKNSYEALRVSDIGTEDFYNSSIELGFPNPAHPNTTKARGINIHKPGGGQVTGLDSQNRAISQGCLLIDRDRWTEFMKLFPSNTRISVTLQR